MRGLCRLFRHTATCGTPNNAERPSVAAPLRGQPAASRWISDGRLTFLVQQREFVREGGSHREHVLYRLRRVSESARTSRQPSDRISNAA
jgi:hypothetical protein